MSSPAPKKARYWPLILFAWTGIFLVFAAHEYFSSRASGRPTSLLQSIYWSASEWYTWALLTGAVMWVVHRFPISRSSWAAPGTVLALAGVVISVAQILLQYGLDLLVVGLLGTSEASINTWLTGQSDKGFIALGSLVGQKIGFDYIIFWVIVAIGNMATSIRTKEQAAAALEAQLARARLEALRLQLQPHFLFNTLNAISELVHRDPGRAERMIADLAALLRRALKGGHQEEVPLEEELHLLEAYCGIERIRFGSHLAIAQDIEPETLGARVPSLILQPLVENAIRHGVRRNPAGGRVVIRARRCVSGLELEVEDSGPGVPTGQPIIEGVGLANTRARLGALYGLPGVLELGQGTLGGWRVRIRIPWVPA